MFTPETLPRLIFSLAIIVIGLAAWWLANRWLLQRASKNVAATPSAGVPSILYFTTPTCAPCKTFQRPALQRIQQMLGDCLKVIEIDAAAQPDLAAQWGVLSVPTTFILDEKGSPRHVNHGPTGVEKLLKQIQAL
jgi:thiol-disulfide isomerase/thioredoxin